MSHLPNKFQYVLSTLLSDPTELLRFAATALTTFKFRFLKGCGGPGSVIGAHTVIINSKNVTIGRNCLLQDRVYIRAGKDGRVTIGDKAALNSFVQIFGHGGIDIGPETQIGPNTVLTTTGHNYHAVDLDRNFSQITLGRRVWIGASCTILPGVTIGDYSVIGAGAVVTKDIPPNSLAMGIPARVIRTFDESEIPQ